MSHKQNDIFYESWEEAKEELKNRVKENVKEELVKIIQNVSDWRLIEDTLRAYRNGLISKKQMEEEIITSLKIE